MINIIKTAISAGNYKLTEIQHKIKKMYILGDLTEEQADELLALASLGISTDAERPELLNMIRSLSTEIENLKRRIEVLEGTADEEGDDQTAYPEWKSWDGISTDYQKGAIVSHNGELWESVYDGQNVWEPGTPGTENLWKKYTTTE